MQGSGELGNETLDIVDENVIELVQAVENVKVNNQLQEIDEFLEKDSKELVAWIRKEIDGNV